MEHVIFPTTACVLACSGPSLNLVDVFSLGLPVVAVSTVIRKITNPNYWIIADYLNEMHGSEGETAYSNPDIIKILPEGKVSLDKNPQSVITCNYDTNNRWPDLEKHLFVGKDTFIRGPHKSVTFALQYLHYVGVKTIIWVGNDLQAKSMKEKYCYPVEEYDMKKSHNYDKTLEQTHYALKNWYPIAKSRGFEWYSWGCGELFESIVPKFDMEGWKRDNLEKSLYPAIPPSPIVFKDFNQSVIDITNRRQRNMSELRTNKPNKTKEEIDLKNKEKKEQLILEQERLKNTYKIIDTPLPPTPIELPSRRSRRLDLMIQMKKQQNKKP